MGVSTVMNNPIIIVAQCVGGTSSLWTMAFIETLTSSVLQRSEDIIMDRSEVLRACILLFAVWGVYCFNLNTHANFFSL